MAKKQPNNEVEKIGPKKSAINWAAVYQYLLDYCNDTTIHGFKVSGKFISSRAERSSKVDFRLLSSIWAKLLDRGLNESFG
jgi:hypothetical protein